MYGRSLYIPQVAGQRTHLYGLFSANMNSFDAKSSTTGCMPLPLAALSGLIIPPHPDLIGFYQTLHLLSGATDKKLLCVFLTLELQLDPLKPSERAGYFIERVSFQ